MTFHVGQKVVCVDDSLADDGKSSLVKKGAIYTIADAFDHWAGPAVLLEEVMPRGQKAGWYARRFRPVVERKTDISIFKKMLSDLETTV